MAVKIALAQTTSGEKWEVNLRKAWEYAEEASRQKAEMIVFPEYFMTYYPMEEGDYQKQGQRLEGEFVREMGRAARETGLWMVFGVNETGKDRNYNTIVILDAEGQLRGDYRKTHLFDAYRWKESDDTMAGDEIFCPVDSPAGKIGIGTCYDLRFPELARMEALQGAQVMLYPSAWVKGENKFMQWETLLRARAIENEMYVFGCCHYSEKHYMGRSLGFDPSGREILRGGEKEELLTGGIELEEIKKVRHANPVFSNRRGDLYHI